MGLIGLVQALIGFFKFYDDISPIIRKLAGMSEQARKAKIASLHAAFEKSEASQGDTSDIEKELQ